ncbi:MAG: alpha-glucan family phosphorylase [Myxococcota bacterium]|nr:alpha-glucan family phosphorylase [Myxococcota bacterium]
MGDGQSLRGRLGEVAANLWWSWQPEGEALWRGISEEGWRAAGSSAVNLLKQLDDAALEAAFQGNTDLEEKLNELESRWHAELDARRWYDEVSAPCGGTVAYFCAEYGLHESLLTYSGGLGILAGDHLKSASDLGIPLVAVGLLYQEGYVIQEIDAEGQQGARFPKVDFTSYPLTPALNPAGEQVVVEVEIFGEPCAIKVWELKVGKVRLFLLDTLDPSNSPELAAITSRLYGGGNPLRIRQELVLGVGGVRALRALEIPIAGYHLNEGHSSFLNLERLREYLSEGLAWDEALRRVRTSSLFTTHTPVEAGHDRFDVGLAWAALEGLAGALSLNREQLLALGHWPDESDPNSLFNMTLLAMHTCDHLNGVAALHGEVSRQMFRRFWGETPTEEVPIGHVTNGVHAATWQSPEVRALVKEALGAEALEAEPEEESPARFTAALPDAALWGALQGSKRRLIELARRREGKRRARLGLEPWADRLDPEALTIGFARRFATYKRADLIFQEMDRLLQIIEAAPGPVQLFFAGKAHPADEGGKALVRAVYQASQHPKLAGRVLLIEDYDMEVGRALVQGSDVWLNNPRRPKEASGTSGMKAAMSGVPNLSILDGWWPEGYRGDNGWAFGAEKDYSSQEAQDNEDRAALYETLESAVIPAFYERNESGLPERWLACARASIVSCAQLFHSHRQVRDYTRLYYTKISH